MRSNVNSENLRAMKYLEKEREIGLVLWERSRGGNGKDRIPGESEKE